MLHLRLFFAALFMVSLPFGICGGSSSPGFDQSSALKSVLAAIGNDPNVIPPVGSEYNCTLHVSNQPTPPTSPLHDLKGSCIWTMVEQSGNWLATFHESWLCDDWSASAPGYTDCVPPTGSHQWQYQVFPDGGVQQISSSGAYAPDQH